MSKKTVQQVVQEIKERQAAENAERDAKIKKMADAIREKQAAERREEEQRIGAQRAEREKKFDEELERDARAAFFGGNPGASEKLYQSVRDDFRKQVLRERAESASRHSHSLYKW